MSEIQNHAKEYLVSRLENIKQEKNDLIASSAKNQNKILELNSRMLEIMDKIDEAYEIFSPNPRNSEYDKTEIVILAEKQNELKELSEKLIEKAKNLEMEEEKIRQSVKFIDDGSILSNSIIERKCYQHYYMDIQNQMEEFKNNLLNQIESVANTKTKNIINNMKCNINNIKQFDKNSTLAVNLEAEIKEINKSYGDRVGVFYQEISDNLSVFDKSIFTKLIIAILMHILNSDSKVNVVISLYVNNESANIKFDMKDFDMLDIEKLVHANIGVADSGLLISDLLSICNGIVEEKSIMNLKSFIININNN